VSAHPKTNSKHNANVVGANSIFARAYMESAPTKKLPYRKEKT